eukprot:13706261-Alexandrium_andersonii.AAC.1
MRHDATQSRPLQNCSKRSRRLLHIWPFALAALCVAASGLGQLLALCCAPLWGREVLDDT